MRLAAIVIPDHLAEVFFANGWRLTDEPCCGVARVAPPSVVGVNRVPNMKIAGRAGKREPASVKTEHVGYNPAGHVAQYRLQR